MIIHLYSLYIIKKSSTVRGITRITTYDQGI